MLTNSANQLDLSKEANLRKSVFDLSLIAQSLLAEGKKMKWVHHKKNRSLFIK